MKAIRIKQVIEKVSLSQSTIYKMIAEGGFPKPFQLAPNRVGWLEEDIDAWLAVKAGRKAESEDLRVAESAPA
ncbi:AlpA family transcriptional regulator [Paraburkholderia caballeronis]|uniref:Transcriptional regulator, AlpA family n=1 Tax=Paraburkholderia caballeronis TaxID=416943 RepID=A0A1H7U787_9BURK|nr:AlpA family transcriptional regulator [Paraburkholderia caballeronis]PXW23365.1 AlpA family transcriptional regulator [Paraburkholderia caballeronis]PXW98358.1 AlpA family transcriptional regulator [Paraburkholderia caballeronis]RAJ95088.1 AlpA family transcriptional regulator [Paraburkholderia caballeronis]SEC57745.1 transcriptional regulator, AlpA family [Paraburkholderia caballeronis]SEL92659.1 transcriptional regulator, AlpA family [Paraburkholderia caballeronis]